MYTVVNHLEVQYCSSRWCHCSEKSTINSCYFRTIVVFGFLPSSQMCPYQANEPVGRSLRLLFSGLSLYQRLWLTKWLKLKRMALYGLFWWLAPAEWSQLLHYSWIECRGAFRRLHFLLYSAFLLSTLVNDCQRCGNQQCYRLIFDYSLLSTVSIGDCIAATSSGMCTAFSCDVHSSYVQSPKLLHRVRRVQCSSSILF